MIRKGRTFLSQLMGRDGDLGTELLAAEQVLSERRFPRELLSEELQMTLDRYENWFVNLPLRDAQELSFAILLSNEFPQLQEGSDEITE